MISEKIYNDAMASGFKPDPHVDYATWADRYFYLPRESSAEYGRFRVSRTPFIREILEALSPQNEAETITLIKPTQLAGTTVGIIFITGIMDMYPGPILFIGPTDNLVKSFSKKKLAKSIKAISRLTGKVAESKSRDSGNTILEKEFVGGSIKLTGSNSGASYRSESIKYLIIDDFDGFDVNIAGEGDPRTLADRRTGTFPGRKVYINSTTTLKETSNIERSFDVSSQGFFNVPCPHCNHFQYLKWGGVEADFGIKFKRDDDNQVIDAWYKCKSCHKRIDEHKKQWMSENGKYVHKYPERKKNRGFRYNALVSPVGWVNTWKYIVEENLVAVKEMREGNPSKYITWLNTLMSEPYEESGDRPEWATLKARCEPYQPMSVPASGKILTAGIDVQHNRLAVGIYAWGAGQECWLIYHVEIAGDPMHSDVWKQLDQLLYRPWPHASGVEMRICSAGVDSGDGKTTQAVRNYCRFRGPIVFALKGSSQRNKPVIGVPSKQDISWEGEKIDGGIEVWPIGTDTAKATLYSRLQVKEPGPGYIHFYIGTSDEYFLQLTAEKLITRFVKGYPVQEWHNVRGNRRNEQTDCYNYAYGAAIRVGVDYINLDHVVPGKRKETQRRERPAENKNSGWLGGGGGFGKTNGFL